MKEAPLDYPKELKKLQSAGPGRLYVLYGEEEYLLRSYLDTLRSMTVADSDFSSYLFDGMPPLEDLRRAVDTVPFLSPRSLVEIRNCDLCKLKDEECQVLSSIPDTCTVVLVLPKETAPDNRLKAVKFLKDNAVILNFTEQTEKSLIHWMQRRLAASGKELPDKSAERLLFLCGKRMSSLIPELDKVAAYASGNEITLKDVEAVATPLIEAEAFDLVSLMSKKKFDESVALMADLLLVRKTEPIAVVSAFAYQFRQLYGAKIGDMEGRRDYRSDLTKKEAVAFSVESLRNCISICADTEYLIKTSAMPDTDLLKNMLVKLILEVGSYGDCRVR